MNNFRTKCHRMGKEKNIANRATGITKHASCHIHVNVPHIHKKVV